MKKDLPTNNPIVQDGDPVLRKIAHRVRTDQFGTKELQNILARMKKLLAAEDDGVAIAAPQIGESLRIFVVSRRAFMIDEEEEDEKRVYKKKEASAETERLADMVFINPEITKLSRKKVTVPEGCLSVRWKYGNTRRSDKAIVRAQDEKGKFFTYGGSGLLAQIFQHETDHLNGILFIDHATEIEDLPPEKVEEVRKHARERHGE